MRLFGLLAIFTALGNGSTIYSVVNLGNLGGSSATGYQINDAGDAIGWAETVTGNDQSFVADPGGSMATLHSVAGSDSYAYGINAAGVIVGTSYVNGQPHGTMWTSTNTFDIGAGIYAMAINGAGTIAGSNGHAFRLVNGTYQDLGTLAGGGWSAAYAINGSGTAVGYGDLASGLFRAVVWNADGSMLQLGTLGGANSYATGINDPGDVIGHAGTASGYEHAFVETGGSMHDLGTLAGGSSYAYGINNAGAIVGYSWSENEADPSAFVYSGGVMQDLNLLIPASLGWQLEEAYGINSAGQIVGQGWFDGQSCAFLLDPVDPVPEPRELSRILVGLGLFAVFCRRQRMRYRS